MPLTYTSTLITVPKGVEGLVLSEYCKGCKSTQSHRALGDLNEIVDRITAWPLLKCVVMTLGSPTFSPQSDAGLPFRSARSRVGTTLSDLSDARVWLEDVEGASALEWVKAKNSEALHVLGNPAEQHVYSRIL